MPFLSRETALEIFEGSFLNYCPVKLNLRMRS